MNNPADTLAALADKLVTDWQQDGKIPPMAWHFREFAIDAMNRALASLKGEAAEPTPLSAMEGEAVACGRVEIRGVTTDNPGYVHLVGDYMQLNRARHAGHGALLYTVPPPQQAEQGQEGDSALEKAYADACEAVDEMHELSGTLAERIAEIIRQRNHYRALATPPQAGMPAMNHELERFKVQVEKRLCAIIGKHWQPAGGGICIDNLCEEIAARIATNPTPSPAPQGGGEAEIPHWALPSVENALNLLDHYGFMHTDLAAVRDWLKENT